MHTDIKKPKKLTFLMVGAVVVAAVAVGFVVSQFSAHSKVVLETRGNQIGGSFRLVSVVEDFVTDADYRGKWMLVYFGDAHCPADICGRTLSALEQAVDAQKQNSAKFAPLFISLDPVRDDSTTLHNYAKQFGSHIQPLMGSENMLKAVAAEYHAPWHQVALGSSDHYMQPSPQIVIMDPDGHYAGTIDANASADTIAARLSSLMQH